jgi:ArsR family transcriptional regulator, zinc-responsive transcriptional repressor
MPTMAYSILEGQSPNEAARLFRALGNLTRLEILILLDFNPATGSELAVALDCPQPTIAKHLRALASLGVIEATTKNNKRPYRLLQTEIAPFISALAKKEERNNQGSFLDEIKHL